MLSKYTDSILFKAIALVLVCLFIANDIAWAAPQDHYASKSATLAPPTQVYDPEFRTKFALGQFRLATEGVKHYIKEAIERLDQVFKDSKEGWKKYRTEYIDINNTPLGGRIYGKVRGLESVVFVKLPGFFASTGQYSWIDLCCEMESSKEFGGIPVIYIDSMYCNTSDKCIQRHEIDEILQWEDFRINVLHISDKEKMGFWIGDHISEADSELQGTIYEGMNSCHIAELFYGYSYPLRSLDEVSKESADFDYKYIQDMLRMYPVATSRRVNIAAHAEERSAPNEQPPTKISAPATNQNEISVAKTHHPILSEVNGYNENLSNMVDIDLGQRIYDLLKTRGDIQSQVAFINDGILSSGRRRIYDAQKGHRSGFEANDPARSVGLEVEKNVLAIKALSHGDSQETRSAREALKTRISEVVTKIFITFKTKREVIQEVLSSLGIQFELLAEPVNGTIVMVTDISVLIKRLQIWYNSKGRIGLLQQAQQSNVETVSEPQVSHDGVHDPKRSRNMINRDDASPSGSPAAAKAADAAMAGATPAGEKSSAVVSRVVDRKEKIESSTLNADEFENKLIAMFGLDQEPEWYRKSGSEDKNRFIKKNTTQIKGVKYKYTMTCRGDKHPLYFRAGDWFVINPEVLTEAESAGKNEDLNKLLAQYDKYVYFAETNAKYGWPAYGYQNHSTTKEEDDYCASMGFEGEVPYYVLPNAIQMILAMQLSENEIRGKTVVEIGSRNALAGLIALKMGASRAILIEKEIPKAIKDNNCATEESRFWISWVLANKLGLTKEEFEYGPDRNLIEVNLKINGFEEKAEIFEGNFAEAPSIDDRDIFVIYDLPMFGVPYENDYLDEKELKSYIKRWGDNREELLKKSRQLFVKGVKRESILADILEKYPNTRWVISGCDLDREDKKTTLENAKCLGLKQMFSIHFKVSQHFKSVGWTNSDGSVGNEEGYVPDIASTFVFYNTYSAAPVLSNITPPLHGSEEKVDSMISAINEDLRTGAIPGEEASRRIMQEVLPLWSVSEEYVTNRQTAVDILSVGPKDEFTQKAVEILRRHTEATDQEKLKEELQKLIIEYTVFRLFWIGKVLYPEFKDASVTLRRDLESGNTQDLPKSAMNFISDSKLYKIFGEILFGELAKFLALRGKILKDDKFYLAWIHLWHENTFDLMETNAGTTKIIISKHKHDSDQRHIGEITQNLDRFDSYLTTCLSALPAFGIILLENKVMHILQYSHYHAGGYYINAEKLNAGQPIMLEEVAEKIAKKYPLATAAFVRSLPVVLSTATTAGVPPADEKSSAVVRSTVVQGGKIEASPLTASQKEPSLEELLMLPAPGEKQRWITEPDWNNQNKLEKAREASIYFLDLQQAANAYAKGHEIWITGRDGKSYFTNLSGVLFGSSKFEPSPFHNFLNVEWWLLRDLLSGAIEGRNVERKLRQAYEVLLQLETVFLRNQEAREASLAEDFKDYAGILKKWTGADESHTVPYDSSIPYLLNLAFDNTDTNNYKSFRGLMKKMLTDWPKVSKALHEALDTYGIIQPATAGVTPAEERSSAVARSTVVQGEKTSLTPYLVHSIKTSGDVNPFENHKAVKKMILSANVISPEFVKTFTPAGFILHVPEKDILKTIPGNANTPFFRDNLLRNPERRAKIIRQLKIQRDSPGSILSFEELVRLSKKGDVQFNEVVVTGAKVIGVFVREDYIGNTAFGTRYKITIDRLIKFARNHHLPFVFFNGKGVFRIETEAKSEITPTMLQGSASFSPTTPAPRMDSGTRVSNSGIHDPKRSRNMINRDDASPSGSPAAAKATVTEGVSPADASKKIQAVEGKIINRRVIRNSNEACKYKKRIGKIIKSLDKIGPRATGVWGMVPKGKRFVRRYWMWSDFIIKHSLGKEGERLISYLKGDLAYDPLDYEKQLRELTRSFGLWEQILPVLDTENWNADWPENYGAYKNPLEYGDISPFFLSKVIGSSNQHTKANKALLKERFTLALKYWRALQAFAETFRENQAPKKNKSLSGSRQFSSQQQAREALRQRIAGLALGQSPSLDFTRDSLRSSGTVPNSEIENALQVFNKLTPERGKETENRYFIVKYNKTKLQEGITDMANSPEKVINTYLDYLEVRLPKGSIERKPEDGRDGLISVECYSDGNLIGKGSIDIEEYAIGEPLAIIGMLNIAFFASQVSKDAPSEDYFMSFIRKQCRDILGSDMPNGNIIFDPKRGLQIKLPHAGKIPLNTTLEEYYRVMIERLNQSP